MRRVSIRRRPSMPAASLTVGISQAWGEDPNGTFQQILWPELLIQGSDIILPWPMPAFARHVP
jgi:hypothetical protein